MEDARPTYGGRDFDAGLRQLLQHRTDGTDAFDTLYIGCEKFPQQDFYGGFPVGGIR